jgi:hypothetical protein
MSQEDADTFNFPNSTTLSPAMASTSPNMFGRNNKDASSSKNIYSVLSPITPHVIIRGSRGSDDSTYSPFDPLDSGMKLNKLSQKIASIKKSARKNNRQGGGSGGLYEIMQTAAEEETFGSSTVMSEEEKNVFYRDLIYNYDHMDARLKPSDPDVRPGLVLNWN